MTKEKVVVFGAGNAGASAHSYLQDKVSVIAFCDNDGEKWESKLNGIPIIAPSRLTTLGFDSIYIASEYFEQIEQQLLRDKLCQATQIHILPAAAIKPLQIGQDRDTASMTLKILALLSSALEANACNYYIDAGTLLGVVRDNALIPWDDDLDFACDSDSLAQVELTLNALLPELAALTGAEWALDTHYANQAFGAVAKGAIRGLKLRPLKNKDLLPLVDVFVKYIQGETMDYVLSSRGITMPSRHIKNTHLEPFSGFSVRLPYQEQQYLTAHYGDWQVPQKEWNLSMIKSASVFKA